MAQMTTPKLGKPTPIQVPKAPAGMQIKKAKVKVKYESKAKGMC